MATVKRELFVAAVAALVALALALLGACDDLDGLGGEAPPLTTLSVEVTGDLDEVSGGADVTELRLGVVWAAVWLSEITCTTVPTTGETDLAALLLTGCRNPFAFTPARTGPSIAVEPNVPAEMHIDSLPAGDVMVGTLSARIAYASLVVFDDRDRSGQLELGRTQRPPIRDYQGMAEDEADPENPMTDVVYGASFVAMTEPDTRLAFREGDFNAAAVFYPRQGCGDPPPLFSVLSAGGFALTDAYDAVQNGTVPAQDPATCAEETLDEAAIRIALRADSTWVREVARQQRHADGQVRYHHPPVEPIDRSDRSWLCRVVPETEVTELIVSQRESDPCRGLTHYVLRGCDDSNDLGCELPDWDLTSNPPDWWPCAEPAP